MRIVVAAVSAPEHLNGVSRHAANVVRGLLTRSEISEIHLLVGEWQQHTYTEAVARHDTRLHIHPVAISRGTASRNIWYYSELPRIASQLNADVVHLAYPVPIAAREFTSPTVVTLHDLYPFEIPENFGFLKSALNRQLVRQCLKAADGIACVSTSTRQQLGRWLGSSYLDKAVTVPNSVEPAPFHCGRGPNWIERGKAFLLCVAQHRRNKNILLALRIFEESLRSRLLEPETKLVLLGVPGPETGRIEKRIRQSRLERSVVVLSGINDADLQWCYRNCELLLAPSVTEGFGLPVVEALLAGCKVVCSDIPAFREIGAEGCHYVRLGDGELEEFTKAIGKARRAPHILPVSMPWLSASAIAEKYIILYRHLQTRLLSQRIDSLRISHLSSRDGA